MLSMRVVLAVAGGNAEEDPNSEDLLYRALASVLGLGGALGEAKGEDSGIEEV
jgi:hypothetical protein